MNDQFHITKLEAAQRQLRIAICLLFENADPVAIHTLVGAASVIISDLVEHRCPEMSWDKLAQEANGITASEYYQVMRKPQNFLKHAAKDPDGTFNFDPVETESVAFWAVMNIANLGHLSIEESVFQLWFLASHAPDLDRGSEVYEVVKQVFGDLRNTTRNERIQIGRKILNEQQQSAG